MQVTLRLAALILSASHHSLFGGLPSASDPARRRRLLDRFVLLSVGLSLSGADMRRPSRSSTNGSDRLRRASTHLLRRECGLAPH
jgi:hypothetical protein